MSDFQDSLAPFEAIAKLGRALANRHRLRLLHLLAQGERTVEAAAAAMGLSVVTVSHHLQQLRRVDLVAAHKSGRYVTYGLADATVRAFWLHYRDFASDRLAELQVLENALATRRNALGRVDSPTLQALLENNAAVLADVRPAAEYDAGHLPGAISIPLDQLTQRLRELPADKVIVLYCRGPHCLLADEAQQALAARGIRSLRMDEGVPEWAAAGLPLDRSPHFQPVIPAAAP